MSKFLEGVERHTPNENEGKGPFRVEYRDVVGNLMATVVIKDDVGSSYEEFIKFGNTTNGVFELAEPAIKPEAAAEEDFEMIDNMRQKKIDKFEKNSGNITGTLTAAQELRAADPNPMKPSRGVKRINKEVDQLGKVIAKNVKRVAKMLK